MAKRTTKSRLTHGHTVGHISRTYRTWTLMKSRCLDPNSDNYHKYGARGIKVCEQWLSFENFLADMGERPLGTSIDRYPDPHGNYEPGNCRWATPSEQNMNKTNAVMIEYQGTIKNMGAWAKSVGMRHAVLWQRLRRGWTMKEALTRPVGKHGDWRTPARTEPDDSAGRGEHGQTVASSLQP